MFSPNIHGFADVEHFSGPESVRLQHLMYATTISQELVFSLFGSKHVGSISHLPLGASFLTQALQ